MDTTAQVAMANDGRTLVFAEWGDLEGAAVFALHGTPGCRLNRHPDAGLIASTGVRLITYDRPGYGGSDRHRGRTVADCAADVAAIADHVGLEHFAVSGASGGGPHALAVAALLGDRATRAACVVGVAPYDALGESWFEGMDPENVKEFRWALEGEARLTEEIELANEHFREIVLSDPAALLAEFELPESDRDVLAREDVMAQMRESIVEQSRNGVFGWVDDDLAMTVPWGFDPASIAIPVRIEYGNSDVLVPPGHGRWLAETVPAAEVKMSGLGHLGDPDADLVDLHAWLTRTA